MAVLGADDLPQPQGRIKGAGYGMFRPAKRQRHLVEPWPVAEVEPHFLLAERAVAPAKARRSADRHPHELPRTHNRCLERQAAGEIGRDCRGKRAAGAVRVPGLDWLLVQLACATPPTISRSIRWMPVPCPPFTSKARALVATAVSPPSAASSGRFGVTRAAISISRAKAAIVASSASGAPLVATITGSKTIGTFHVFQPFGDPHGGLGIPAELNRSAVQHMRFAMASAATSVDHECPWIERFE